jgi:hypothetical protein
MVPFNESGKNNVSDFKDGVYGFRSNAKYVNGAVINALHGGVDYSNGGVMWDGWDLAQLSMKQRKPSNHGILVDVEMAKSWGNYWKNLPGQKQYWAKNFKPLSSSTSYSCISTAQQGGTIFWKIADNPTKNTKADYF